MIPITTICSLTGTLMYVSMVSLPFEGASWMIEDRRFERSISGSERGPSGGLSGDIIAASSGASSLGSEHVQRDGSIHVCQLACRLSLTNPSL